MVGRGGLPSIHVSQLERELPWPNHEPDDPESQEAGPAQEGVDLAGVLDHDTLFLGSMNLDLDIEPGTPAGDGARSSSAPDTRNLL